MTTWTDVIDTLKSVTTQATGIQKVLLRDEERPFHDNQMVFMDLDVQEVQPDYEVWCPEPEGRATQMVIQHRRLSVVFNFESTQHRPEVLGPVLASKFIAGVRRFDVQQTLQENQIALATVAPTSINNYSFDGRRVSAGGAIAVFNVALAEVVATGVDCIDKIQFSGTLEGGKMGTVTIPETTVGPVNPQPALQTESERSFLWVSPDAGTLANGSRTWVIPLPLTGMVDDTYIVVPEQISGSVRPDFQVESQTTTEFTLVAVDGFLIVGSEVRFYVRDSDEPAP